MAPRATRAAAPEEPTSDDGLDVNAVVSYNMRAIRDRRGMTQQAVADGLARLTELYRALLGTDHQLDVLDDRLTDIQIDNPNAADQALAAIAGPDRAMTNWHDHYRTWRTNRIREIEREYGDQLTDIADTLGRFANDIQALGPAGYLHSAAHREGDPLGPIEGAPVSD